MIGFRKCVFHNFLEFLSGRGKQATKQIDSGVTLVCRKDDS